MQPTPRANPSAADSPTPQAPLTVAEREREERALLQANNTELQRDVEALKELVQILSSELEAARHANAPGAHTSREAVPRGGHTAPTTASTAREDYELYSLVLRQQHQEQVRRLHSVLAEKDAIIAQLSMELRDQHARWLSEVKRMTNEKNTLIASLVEQVSRQYR